MEIDYEKLKDLFASDPLSAIEESQKIICSVSNFDSYKDFFSYNLQNAHISTCQNEWPSTELCIFCRDCAVDSSSCICIECFLNGNHEGHHYLYNECSGNCDCGDTSFWKRSGFCKKHAGQENNQEHPENYIDEKLRNTLTDVIFKAALSVLKNYAINDPSKASNIIQFVSSFSQFGDGFRRLISIALTEKIDFKDLMYDISNYPTDFNRSLQQLCGGLINDKFFLRNFSRVSYIVIYDRLIEDAPNIMTKGKESITYQVWNNFWFHSFSEYCFRYNIENFNWNWIDYGVKTVTYFKDIFTFIGNSQYDQIPTVLVTNLAHLKYAAKVAPKEQIQLFFDKLVAEILTCGSRKGIESGNQNDSIIATNFKEQTEKIHFFPIFHFEYFFCSIFNCFKNKTSLKYEKLFEELDKNIDISSIFMIGMNPIGSGDRKENENDKFVSRFLLNQKVENSEDSTKYKSFHNGASFFLCHPLYESLPNLFRIDTMSRIRIARLLLNEKYQSLRVKLGIITMKSILAYLYNRQSIVTTRNKGLALLYSTLGDPDTASKFFTKYIPVFQLLIGLQCKDNEFEFSLKEFFSFELARELGIFDDFTASDYDDENVNEKQKQMIFSYLYISLLLVVDRKLFNYYGIEFIKEQIIFALKRGEHLIEHLNKLFDSAAIPSWSHVWVFNDILMEVSSTTRNSNEDEEQQQQLKNQHHHQQQQQQQQQQQPSGTSSYNQETLFYLKNGVKWNTISAINAINEEMTLMNDEIRKNSDKLISIPDFEPEETFFFKPLQKEIDKNLSDYNSEGLNIRLKQFLFTPTTLAIVYHTLRTNSSNSDLNDHLAMNILILVARFIKEEQEQKAAPSSFDESTTIQYEDVVDLIKKFKTVVFNYRVDENGNSFVQNTLTQSSFISLLKMKIGSNELPPKSFIDVLLSKGKLGHNVLEQISEQIHLDFLDVEKEKESEQEAKESRRLRARKLKEEIMNQYRERTTNYIQHRCTDSTDDFSASNSSSLFLDKEVCSICSSNKKNEVFCYPLYMYRTKFPFIIDKPPLVPKDAEGIAIDDNAEDFDFEEDEVNENNDNEEEEEEEESKIDPNSIFSIIVQNFPELANMEGLNEEETIERKNLIKILFKRIYDQIVLEREQKKIGKTIIHEAKKYKKKEEENYKRVTENDQFKRCTVGANFILQFSVCQHPVHPKCVNEMPFTCPIDRSVRNSLLPVIDTIPKYIISKDMETFDANSEDNENEDSLATNAMRSIKLFIDNFVSFFDCVKSFSSQNVFVELVKSLSALISTYEIRLRSLPDCLDTEKAHFLPRNLFLTVWYGYRIEGKPPITENDSNLTLFQRFIKRLIECEEIGEVNQDEFVSAIVSSFIKDFEVEIKDDSKKEKMLYLFLRRVCLAEHFLLENSMQDFIDWDEVLSPSNLNEKYGSKFILTENEDKFELKPFSFMKFPKNFLNLLEKPFCLPINKITELTIFNMIDYNFLIRHYDEVTGEVVVESDEEEEEKNKNNVVRCNEKELGNLFENFFGRKHYPSVIFFVGKFASQVFLIDRSSFACLGPFYLDKYGCADIGHKRSQPLFFNEEKFERCIDKILSGDFAYSLFSLDNLK